jgi:hypothetical protein
MLAIMLSTKNALTCLLPKNKEINNVYLKHVQADRTLEEAYRIMMDWIVK